MAISLPVDKVIAGLLSLLCLTFLVVSFGKLILTQVCCAVNCVLRKIWLARKILLTLWASILIPPSILVARYGLGIFAWMKYVANHTGEFSYRDCVFVGLSGAYLVVSILAIFICHVYIFTEDLEK